MFTSRPELLRAGRGWRAEVWQKEWDLDEKLRKRAREKWDEEDTGSGEFEVARSGLSLVLDFLSSIRGSGLVLPFVG
jgi:hypothetical protein